MIVGRSWLYVVSNEQIVIKAKSVPGNRTDWCKYNWGDITE